MGAGKPGVFAGRVIAAAATAGIAALACGCGGAPPAMLAVRPTTGTATPTLTSTIVPVLGRLTLGSFARTWDGGQALVLCEEWAGLRGQYVARVRGETTYELEQWFSSPAWHPAFHAASQFKTDPDYSHITASLGIATIGDTASVATAKMLDSACAAAD